MKHPTDVSQIPCQDGCQVPFQGQVSFQGERAVSRSWPESIMHHIAVKTCQIEVSSNQAIPDAHFPHPLALGIKFPCNIFFLILFEMARKGVFCLFWLDLNTMVG